MNAIQPMTKILATLVGGYKLDAIWMSGHIERANLHWEIGVWLYDGKYKATLFTCLPVAVSKVVFG